MISPDLGAGFGRVLHTEQGEPVEDEGGKVETHQRGGRAHLQAGSGKGPRRVREGSEKGPGRVRVSWSNLTHCWSSECLQVDYR